MAEEEFEEFADDEAAPKAKGGMKGIQGGILPIALAGVIVALLIVAFMIAGKSPKTKQLSTKDVKDSIENQLKNLGGGVGCIVAAGEKKYLTGPGIFNEPIKADDKGTAQDLFIITADGAHMMDISISVAIQIKGDNDGSKSKEWMGNNGPRVQDASMTILSEIYVSEENKMYKPASDAEIKDENNKKYIKQFEGVMMQEVNVGGLRNILLNYYKSMGLSEIVDVMVMSLALPITQ